MGYLPIENYAVIGNLRTVALVGITGAIDWFCFPNFDSPSVFAAILDERKGGRFRIAPASVDGVVYRQMYWPDTNVEWGIQVDNYLDFRAQNKSFSDLAGLAGYGVGLNP
jgi:GH15 family glucan-1,4-alpha-glucosidase